MKDVPQVILETEALFVSVEQSADITISIHDLSGNFRLPDGQSVLSRRRTSHRHPVCRYAHTRYCLRDCQQKVHKMLAVQKVPCSHLCWKGVIEVVTPVFRNNTHIATIFAGCFQQEYFNDTSIETGYRAGIGKLRQQLPVLTHQHQKQLEGLLVLLGKALLQQLDIIHNYKGEANTRKGVICRFIDHNIHKNVTLSDISNHICLSQSRTCHVIHEIFGKSLKKILIEERIDRAKHLLISTDYPLSDIADRVGFSDVYYFSKIFKREVGNPPGKFRKISLSS